MNDCAIKAEGLGKQFRYSLLDSKHQTDKDQTYADGMEQYFDGALGSTVDKLRNFTKFVPRQSLSIFLAKHELFKLAQNAHGNIVECGVHLGGGLMTWAQLCAIYEPYSHVRRIIGFDTFTGFTAVSAKDQGAPVQFKTEGGLATEAEEDLQECIRLFDLNRPIGHIPKIELVKGNACLTIPEYVERNKHLVVSLLYLDFDLYEPTKVALEIFLPRMPKGAMIAFDELNQERWPGETLAVLETVGIRNLRIQKIPFTPGMSYAVIE